MNLTEPQAGSDVGALKARAVKQGDHYLITGQKVFITWGEHDCAENIVHMVLARTLRAPTSDPACGSIAVQEMWSAANLSFSLAPLLTQGAVETLQTHGTAEQKATYLPATNLP